MHTNDVSKSLKTNLCLIIFHAVGALYALVAAHVAQLILNWHNDAFALRQRLNFFGPLRTGSKNPQASMLGPWKRIGRLTFSVLTLALALKFESCNNDDDCKGGVSHATHAFGALAGLLSGCVFLKVGRLKRPIRIVRNILFVFIYGMAVLCIFGMYMKAPDVCSWAEFEKNCQNRCYLKQGTCLQNHCNDTRTQDVLFIDRSYYRQINMSNFKPYYKFIKRSRP